MEHIDFQSKMDHTGRVLIPTKLREELNLDDGELYQYYLHLTDDNHVYLCLDCGIDRVSYARELLNKYGVNYVHYDDITR